MAGAVPAPVAEETAGVIRRAVSETAATAAAWAIRVRIMTEPF
ncbi:hypothetical protein [Kitasatospora sp. NPDC085464]